MDVCTLIPEASRKFCWGPPSTVTTGTGSGSLRKDTLVVPAQGWRQVVIVTSQRLFVLQGPSPRVRLEGRSPA